jgi:hypothetical protein
MSVQETFHKVPESEAGKHWLFWLSLVAVSLTVVHTLNQIKKGKGL